MELTLGDVPGAVGDAEQSVTYADRSGDAHLPIHTRVRFADALHQAGRRAEAETRFREAEQMQAEDQPDYPLLYSLSGFQYCDLLLAAPERAAWQRVLECGDLSPLFENASKQEAADRAGRFLKSADESAHSKACRAVSQRAAQTLKWMQAYSGAPLLDIALDHLTLGRVALYEAILGKAESGKQKTEMETAKSELDAAVDGLRRAGDSTRLPLGLLTRAWLRFLAGARTGPESTQADLDEAWEIAERGPMRLFLADIHLHRARLFGKRKAESGEQKAEEAAYPWGSAQADLAEARRLIEKHGYHRRKEELEDAEQVIVSQSGLPS